MLSRIWHSHIPPALTDTILNLEIGDLLQSCAWNCCWGWIVLQRLTLSVCTSRSYYSSEKCQLFSSVGLNAIRARHSEEGERCVKVWVSVSMCRDWKWASGAAEGERKKMATIGKHTQHKHSTSCRLPAHTHMPHTSSFNRRTIKTGMMFFSVAAHWGV